MKSISSISILALSVSQAVTTCAQQAAGAAGNTGQQGLDTLEEVIVTGSRIVQDGSQAPTPVTAVTTEELTMSAPSNIPDALNKLPQFSGSTSETAGRTFNANSAPLGNYMNLRSLNASRVLVLLNGQRVTPTDRSNAVDVNVLPQMLVKRVDVVTGGASAVYGSDAVSGVVNWVLDTDFQGFKANVQTGTSNEGDSDSYKVGIAGGTEIGERMRFLGSFETYDTDGIPHIYDRDWAHDTFGRGLRNPIDFIADRRRNTISNGGTVSSGALSTFYPSTLQNGATIPTFAKFNPDGTLAPMDMGVWYGRGNSDGGDGGTWGEPRNGGTSISGALETRQLFGRLSFDVSATSELYVQGIYATSDTSFFSTPNNHISGNRTTRIYLDNPYLDNLQTDARQALIDAGEDSFVLGRIFNDIPLVSAETENEYQNLQLGLKGQFNDNWQWDVTYNFGEATQSAAFNEFSMREFWAALDAVRDDDGNIVCGVTLRNPGYMDDCVPINVIGDGNITPEAFNYTRRDSKWEIVNEMEYFNANVVGELFDLPAGPVTLALGAEYRTQELTIDSNSDPAVWSTPEGTDFAAREAFYEGIRGVPLASNPLLFDSVNVGIAEGDQTVEEFYGEMSIPLLEAAPMAEHLSLNLAARGTDYETSGRVTTWKVGTSWEPVDGLRIRANQSRDIAAPGLYSLFAGENVFFLSFVDTHLSDPNAREIVPLFSSQGNENLEPEEADTTTFGFVFQPASVPGLTLSVDWYNVELEGAIARPVTQQLFDECEASNGTASACQFFERNPDLPWSDRSAANRLTKVIITDQNLALLETSGVDMEVGYRFPLADGHVFLRAFANYLDKFDTQGADDAPVVSWAGHTYTEAVNETGLPRWRGMLVQSYIDDRLSLSLSERFTGSFLYNFGGPDEEYAAPLEMPNEIYVDLNLGYTFAGQYQVFLNVQNLFDTDPPITPVSVTNLEAPTSTANYDVVGRYFTLGVRMRF